MPPFLQGVFEIWDLVMNSNVSLGKMKAMLKNCEKTGPIFKIEMVINQANYLISQVSGSKMKVFFERESTF